MNWLLYLFLTCCIFQIVYQWILLRSIIKRKSTFIASNITPKTVSVLICAKNEQQNLEENLPLIFSQEYPVFEIIVVDDGSDIPFTMQHDKLKIITISKEEKIGLGKKYALQKGIEAARNELILLTDADCKPVSKNWITNMTSCITSSKNIVLGISPYKAENTILNALIEYETAQTALQYLGWALVGKPYMSVGRNVLYNTEFIKSKKWSAIEMSIASGDDDLAIQELATQHNTSVCLNTESYTVSNAKNTWKSWILQKTRHYQSGGLYSFFDKMLLGSYLITKASLYILFLILICIQNTPTVVSIFLGYILINTLLQFYFNKYTNINNRWFYTFWNDILYSFFTLILGILSKFRNKSSWK